MKLSFSETAVEDLIRLREFIAQYSPARARKVARQLVNAMKKLASHPRIGKWIPDLPGDIREMAFGEYIVRYAVTANQITILRIWHGLEHRPELLD